MAANIICMKYGTRYAPIYVNRLYEGVKRNMRRDFRFVCFTDDPAGLADGVETQPLPARPDTLQGRGWPSVFTKLAFFRDGCGGLEGPTLFLDIDQIVVGPMDRFFDYEPDKFCIIRNWIERRKTILRGRPLIGNSSCFRFHAGRFDRVWRQYRDDPATAYDKKRFATEQAFMTHAVGLENLAWWPEEWVVSFKRTCHRMFLANLFLPPKPPPPGTSILCFHGDPSPIEAIEGFTEHKGRKAAIHNRTLPAPWVAELWEGKGPDAP